MGPGAEEQAGKGRKFPRTWDENCPGLKAQNSFFDTPLSEKVKVLELSLQSALPSTFLLKRSTLSVKGLSLGSGTRRGYETDTRWRRASELGDRRRR